MDRTKAPTFKVGWSADGSSPGDCVWQLEYLWLGQDEDTTGAAQETMTITSSASATSNGLIIASFTGIDLPAGTDQAFLWRVSRLGSDGSDTISDVVKMKGCIMEFTADKLGTAL